MVFLELPHLSLPVSSTFLFALCEASHLSLLIPCHVTLKDDSPIYRLYLCHLFHVLSKIMILIYKCTRVHLYTIAVCTDGIYVYVCYWLLFV